LIKKGFVVVYVMKLKEFYNKNKLEEGNKVDFSFEDSNITGTIIPSLNENLMIKMNTGYNAGFDITKIKEIKSTGKAKGVAKATAKKFTKDPKLPTISLLHTGGTIASRVDYKTGGVIAGFEAQDLASMFPEIFELANIEPKLVSNMMSEDMTEENYKQLADAVAKEIKKGVKGIIIGHGTDTLGYSAALLSFMFENCPIPVLIVGAQRSSDRGSSDARINFICAAEFITKTSYKGVATCLHASTNDESCAIINGTRSRKMHTSRRDAFKAINDTPVALVNYKTKEIKWIKNKTEMENANGKFALKDKFEPKTGLVKMHPGINEKIIEFYTKEKYKGLIIEATGLGHTPIGKNEIFIKKIKSLVDSGCIVGITSQCINGRTNNTVYTNLRKVAETGAIYCEDMTSETALMKLSWLLGNYSKKEASELLSKNLRGEISEFSNAETYEE
jgi:glutamyl-tRNA(Gln) amidotransferase subunit D